MEQPAFLFSGIISICTWDWMSTEFKERRMSESLEPWAHDYVRPSIQPRMHMYIHIHCKYTVRAKCILHQKSSMAVSIREGCRSGVNKYLGSRSRKKCASKGIPNTQRQWQMQRRKTFPGLARVVTYQSSMPCMSSFEFLRHLPS